MYTTYSDVLLARRESRSHVVQRFLTSGAPLELTGAELVQNAMQRGGELMALGLARHERVAVLVTEPSDFLPLLYGCLLYGLVAVPFYPPPLIGDLQAYQAALEAVLQVADVQLAVVDDGSARRFGATFAKRRVIELSAMPAPRAHPLPLLEPSDLALLQFTSGSTKAPRGVRITHWALLANARAIMCDGLNATRSDHGVCWLPLYHDMGLVGFGLAPLLTETPVTFIPTSRFIRNPNIWLQTLHDVRGTITFAPNFAYALATKRANAQGFDLSSVRMWGCGAEPISESTLQGFEHHFASSGVVPGSVAPCYGLAEATLAVTFTPPRAVRAVRLLESGTSGPVKDVSPEPNAARSVVSCGKPLPGYSLLITDPEGRPLQEGELGEVVVKGPSLADGYENNPIETAATFQTDGLHTGDRGFLRDGELFIVGRLKELIVLNGRKYDPHALEAAIETLPGVRRAVAVNVNGTAGEVLAVVLERTLEPGQTDETLRNAARAVLASRFGVQANHVICAAPGKLPRTTSGKLQRTKVRLMVERSEFP